MIEVRARSFFHLLTFVALLQSVAGCGSSGAVSGTVPVSGKVTYNGQAVAGATVSFIGEGEGSRTAVATTNSDGSYSLTTLDSKGALPGNYSVTVTKSEMPADTGNVSMEEASKPGYKPPVPKDLLPAKYAAPGTSPLKFEVKAGGGAIDLALSD